MRARTAEDVGSLVREQRLARGMSQAGLAQAVGASRQWVVDLERGKPTLALGLVLRALTAVGLSLQVEPIGAVSPGSAHAAIDLDAIIARARTAAPRDAKGDAGTSRGATRTATKARSGTKVRR
jgi:HTH-type transcriptional regulator/antitoxin HipB